MTMIEKDSEIQFFRPQYPLADVGISLDISDNSSTLSQKVSPSLSYF